MNLGFHPIFTITNRITQWADPRRMGLGFQEVATLSEARVLKMGCRALILGACQAALDKVVEKSRLMPLPVILSSFQPQAM
jgi:hypothetical protein